MAGTRSSTRQATITSADSDRRRPTRSMPAPKGNNTTQGGRGTGKAPAPVKKVAGSRRSTVSSQVFSRAGSTDSSQNMSKFNELKKLEKKKALAAQAKADAGMCIFSIKYCAV